MESLKELIKKLLPTPIIKQLGIYHSKLIELDEKLSIKREYHLHSKAILKIKKKNKPVNVVFLALMDTVWKYDGLYKLMKKDKRFNPLILVCPVVNYGKDNMLRHMEHCYSYFKNEGYNVIKSYDSKTNRYIDLKKDINPDIIFYTNPYKGLIDNRYFITQYPEILTCYVPYFFSNTSDNNFTYNQILHNLVWRRYLETNISVKESRIFSLNKKNAIHTGYPGTDIFSDDSYKAIDVWKKSDKKIKRIIWAPHHTITNYVPVFYSTFLTYCDFMFELADKYKDHIQIAFKPHPILRNRLNIEWGKVKTDEYYKKWENLDNGQLSDGPYVDLFLTSDAIMHDSGSFIAEYLFTGKPALHLDNGTSYKKRYNEIALKCLEQYYIAENKQEIEQFILNIINDNDPKRNERLKFVKEELMPPNGKTASQNIIEDIVATLFSV